MKTTNFTRFFSSAFKSIFLLLIGLVFSTAAYSTSYYFYGTSSTDWNTAANWSTDAVNPSIGSAVPTATDIVTINSGITVVIANGATAACSKIALASTANLTNNGTLNIAALAGTTGSTLTLNGTNTFDNEGTFTLSNSSQTTASAVVNFVGTANSMKFNGTNNLSAKASSQLFSASSNSATTITGTGFTLGANSNGSGIAYTVFNLTNLSATITIDTNTTLNIYIAAAGVSAVGLGGSSTFVNNGTVNTTFPNSTAISNCRSITMYITTASVFCTFTNNGTYTMTNFTNPTLMGGSAGYCKLQNTKILTIDAPGIASSIGLLSQSSLPNVISNSSTGVITLNVATNAIKINASGDTFSNDGTINIKKGDIESAGTVAPLNNNATGVFNFNYGVAAGTTNAVWAAVLNNYGTVRGSANFPNGTLVNYAGCTLSPGDYTGGVSSIGTMKTNNASTLANINIKVINFPTTPVAGTDFDLLSLGTSAMTITANSTLTISVTASTPTVGTTKLLMYASGLITGTFAYISVPNGYKVSYNPTGTGGVNGISLTYDGTSVYTAVNMPSENDYSKIAINKSGIISNIDGNVQIYAINGKMLTSQKVTIGQSIGLPTGAYIVKIQSGDKQSRLKVII